MSVSGVLSLFVIKPIDRSLASRSPTEIGNQFINGDDQLNRGTHHIMQTTKS